MIWPFKRKRTLADTLKPRPDLRERRFASWSMDRRQRYLDAVFGEPQSLKRQSGGIQNGNRNKHSDKPVHSAQGWLASL